MDDNVQMKMSVKELVRVACDSCGSENYTERYEIPPTAIVTCDHCRFTFLNPRLTSQVMLKKTQDWSREDVVDPERLRIAFDVNTLNLYRSYIEKLGHYNRNNSGRMLDIGCATGAFIFEARKAGWEVEGLEIGAESARYAREELGLKVSNGSLYDFEQPDESYDVIVFLEVIEHLESPAGAIERINRWLKPGGLLLISTPNFNSLYRRLHGTKWWVINCVDEHIMFFTAESLRQMMATRGFNIVWNRIRTIDIAGIIKSYRKERAQDHQETLSYYDSRNTKESIKDLLKKIKLIRLARGGMRLLDYLFTQRISPVYAWGEQLVFIAQKTGGRQDRN